MRRLLPDFMIVLVLGLVWMEMQPATPHAHPAAGFFSQVEQALNQVRVGL